MRKLTVLMLAVLPLAGCTADGEAKNTPVASTGTPAESPSTGAPAMTDVLEVTCTSSGTKVSKAVVAAQPDGLHIRATNNSGDPGTYLSYTYPDRRGGGDRIEPNPKTWVLGFPPGKGGKVACHHDNSTKKDPPVAIEVTVPAGAWSTGGLAGLDCRPGVSSVDWAYGPGRGATPDAALRDLARQNKKKLTWRHVLEGYRDSVDQSYVVFEEPGTPWVSALVTRFADGRFAAQLGSFCEPRKPGA